MATTTGDVPAFRLQADFVVEVCDALVGPVFPQRGQDVTQRVGPEDKTESVADPTHRKQFLPRVTHLVMVPSMSEMMILSSQFQR